MKQGFLIIKRINPKHRLIRIKMSNVSSMSNTLVQIYQICDYLPVVSTATSLCEIFGKCAVLGFCSNKSINENRCLSHINDKKTLRCIVLLVPILGNIIVGVYDLIQHRKAEREREDQDSEARELGLDINQLPSNISERRQIILEKQNEKFQGEALDMQAKALDMQIVGLSVYITEFKKVINDPDYRIPFCYRGANQNKLSYQQDKINRIWSCIKLSLNLLNPVELKEPNEKQQKISELKKELVQLRQSSYQDYIQILSKEDLLQQAQNYYIQSFSKEEKEEIKISVGELTLDTILPKLKERVAQVKNPHDGVEMEKIILQISNPSRISQTFWSRMVNQLADFADRFEGV